MPAVDCTRCGVSLMAEAFAGPPRVWFATPRVIEALLARHGWTADGICPECQDDDA